jgi:hypothetical protein
VNLQQTSYQYLNITKQLAHAAAMDQYNDWELWVSEDESTIGEEQDDADQDNDPTLFKLELGPEDGRPGGGFLRLCYLPLGLCTYISCIGLTRIGPHLSQDTKFAAILDKNNARKR